MRPIAVACDGEFTSFDIIGGDLITYAMVEIMDDYTLGRELLVKARPSGTKYFTAEAAAIHGISYWQASKFPTRIDSCVRIMKWLEPIRDHMPLEFVYHGNGNLDWRWIKMHFAKENLEGKILQCFDDEKITSTVTLARKYLKHIKESEKIDPIKDKKYTKYSLRNVADHYNLDLDHHDALSDARTCGQIYCNIKKGIDIFTGELGL